MHPHKEAACTAVEEMAAGEDHLTVLPLDVLECILIRLDKTDLVAAVLTCKTLYSFMTSDSFLLRMLRQHLSSSREEALTLLHLTRKWPWCQRANLCYTKPFGRNLLKEGSAQQQKEHVDKEHGSGGSERLKAIPHWRILSNGGDGWQVERPPVGADPLPDHLLQEGGGCYVTSYADSCKEQVVRFKEALSGCPKFMRHVQPVISVSEWVAGRHDCDSCYRVSVDLLSPQGRVVQSWKHTEDLGPSYTGTQWVQVSHEFRSYGRGVSAVRFRHSGNDRRFWGGWYGAKMTAARVQLSVDKRDDLDKSADVDEEESETSEEDDCPEDNYEDPGDNYEDPEDSYDHEDNDEPPEDDQQERHLQIGVAGPNIFGNVRNYFKF